MRARGNAARRRSMSAGSAGGPRSALSVSTGPRAAAGRPSAAKRSAEAASWGLRKATRPSSARAAPGARAQARALRAESRAPANQTGTPRAWQASRRLGQISLSTTRCASGRQRRSTRRAAPGVSQGARRTVTRSSPQEAAASRPVTVWTVSRMRSARWSARQRSIRRRTEAASPTLAAWTQSVGPSGAGAPWPKRAPSPARPPRRAEASVATASAGAARVAAAR